MSGGFERFARRPPALDADASEINEASIRNDNDNAVAGDEGSVGGNSAGGFSFGSYPQYSDFSVGGGSAYGHNGSEPGDFGFGGANNYDIEVEESEDFQNTATDDPMTEERQVEKSALVSQSTTGISLFKNHASIPKGDATTNNSVAATDETKKVNNHQYGSDNTAANFTRITENMQGQPKQVAEVPGNSGIPLFKSRIMSSSSPRKASFIDSRASETNGKTFLDNGSNGVDSTLPSGNHPMKDGTDHQRTFGNIAARPTTPASTVARTSAFTTVTPYPGAANQTYTSETATKNAPIPNSRFLSFPTESAKSAFCQANKMMAPPPPRPPQMAQRMPTPVGKKSAPPTVTPVASIAPSKITTTQIAKKPPPTLNQSATLQPQAGSPFPSVFGSHPSSNTHSSITNQHHAGQAQSPSITDTLTFSMMVNKASGLKLDATTVTETGGHEQTLPEASENVSPGNFHPTSISNKSDDQYRPEPTAAGQVQSPSVANALTTSMMVNKISSQTLDETIGTETGGQEQTLPEASENVTPGNFHPTSISNQSDDQYPPASTTDLTEDTQECSDTLPSDEISFEEIYHDFINSFRDFDDIDSQYRDDILEALVKIETAMAMLRQTEANSLDLIEEMEAISIFASVLLRSIVEEQEDE